MDSLSMEYDRCPMAIRRVGAEFSLLSQDGIVRRQGSRRVFGVRGMDFGQGWRTIWGH